MKDTEVVPGLGVRGTSSSGRCILVGSLAFADREGVDMGSLQRDVVNMQSQGLTVVIVSSEGKVCMYMTPMRAYA